MGMPNQTTVQQIMQAPNVLGFVHCSADGEVLIRAGNEVEALATILGHFMRLARLVGGSFGLEDFHEARIQGKPLSVLCMPYEGGAVGVVLDSRARVAEVALTMRRIIDGE